MIKLFLLPLCIIAATSLNALATPWTSSLIPICTHGAVQDYPDIAADGTGGAIIVWKDYRNQDTDLYAQRIDSLGNVLWQTNGVPICTATGYQWFVRIIPDGLGGAIVFWDTQDNNSDIYAQRLDASGNTLWATNGVPVCNVFGGQRYPRVAAVSDENGGAIVVWEDSRNGHKWDIYAQRIDANGSRKWAIDGIAISVTADTSECPEVVADGSGGAIITWARGNVNRDIYAQRVDAFGLVQWAVNGIAICTAAQMQQYPEIASDGAGGAIIAWEDRRNISISGKEVYAQRISANGEIQWNANGLIICGLSGDQRFPYVVSASGQGAIISWQDGRNGADWHLYAQSIDLSGAERWAANGIRITTAPIRSFLYQAKPDNSGGMLLSWCALDEHIYGQRLSSLGTVLWGEGGLQLSSALGEQSAITMAKLNQAIAAWDQHGDIYARVIFDPPQIPAPEGLAALPLYYDNRLLGLRITWNRSSAAKISHYNVYKGLGEDFAPTLGNLLETCLDTICYDFQWRWTPDLYYKVAACDSDGYEGAFAVLGTDALTKAEGSMQPATFLSQCYPNPFNPNTTIRFGIDAESDVSLRIYDAAGRLVRVLLEGNKGRGKYSEIWDGKDAGGVSVASGIYLCQLRAGDKTIAKKMVLLR